MTLNKLVPNSNSWPHRAWDLVLALSFIILLTAGSLVLCSCATTEKGLKREQVTYSILTNTVSYLQPVASTLPPPIGTALEGVLAAGGALLALWATHLHRSLGDLKANGHSLAKSEAGPKPPPA
jgi:hypothetical protein